jgi:hypothetical protein
MSGRRRTISTSETKLEAFRIQSSAYGVTIPVIYGLNRLSVNLVDEFDFKATANTTSQKVGKGGRTRVTNTTYTYSASVIIGLAHGVVSWVPRVWRGKKVFKDEAKTALAQAGLTLFSGSPEQAVWPHSQSRQPANALDYPGLAYLAAADYDLGGTAEVENHNFECVGKFAYHSSTTRADVSPALALADLLTDSVYGAGFPAGRIDGWADWIAKAGSAGIWMSPLLKEQMQAAEVVHAFERLGHAEAVWSDGKLKMVPRDRVNNIALYNLTDDHFLTRGTEPPVVMERKQPSDNYNHVRVEYLDRANGYNVAIANAKDQADIDATGLRSADIVRAHWICDATAARAVAQLLLQRALFVRAKYKFRLPAMFSLLEPTDLLTINDPALLLVQHPVSILEISEEGEDGEMSIVAEDYPFGIYESPLYNVAVGTGFAQNYNVAPGNVAAPMFFEAPVERTVTGLEVYAAVRGASPSWGGCRVWVSLDGTNYRQAALVEAPARYGTLTGPVAGGSVPVQIEGQLISGSAADAQALATLCYVGGATPEYLAYTTATLTGAGAYTLAGLQRGAFGTAVNAHAAGRPFARVDEALAKSGPLELSMIGRQIQFKFTSFNIFGGAEQSLADVVAYSYTITGAQVALPPSQPTGGGYSLEPFGIRLSCAKNPEPDVIGYEWRVGASWATATPLNKLGGTSQDWQVQFAGAFQAWVAAVDSLGNVSTPAPIAGSVTAATVANLQHSINGADLVLDFAGVPGAFAIAGYDIRYGDVFATATPVGVFAITKHTRRVDWGGTRRWWVAAVDVRGNTGPPSAVDVTVATPGPVTQPRAEVVDNNALLFWAPPTTGSLSVERYEVRKGVSWAAGTTVGSNGTSTFTTYFEQQSGTYTYWVAAYDSAGNLGVPVSIVATISQPPDYVLRTNINSAFAGTLTNLAADVGGGYVGPVDTAETWQQHFANRGWTSPQDQVNAGFPLYLNPSLTAGSYEEVFDYGSALPSTTITATLGATVEQGSVSVSCQLYVKLNAGDAWTAGPAGATQWLVGNFRYVRVVYTFSCTAGANVIRMTSFNLKLANKLKTDSGTFVITNANVGVVVPFGIAFIDADTPVCQPNGTVPLVPVVDFLDQPNPTGFTVFLYNQSGSKVTGSGSWTARGY